METVFTILVIIWLILIAIESYQTKKFNDNKNKIGLAINEIIDVVNNHAANQEEFEVRLSKLEGEKDGKQV